MDAESVPYTTLSASLEIAQCGFTGSHARLRYHDSNGSHVLEHDLAVADFVLHPPETMRPILVARMPNSGVSAISTWAIRALVVGIPPGESIPAVLRITTPASVAADEILRTK